MWWVTAVFVALVTALPASSAQESLTIPSTVPVLIVPATTYAIIVRGTREDILKISLKGEIFYKGRLLTTDREILWGLRAALSPWYWCERWEESRIGTVL